MIICRTLPPLGSLCRFRGSESWGPGSSDVGMAGLEKPCAGNSLDSSCTQKDHRSDNIIGSRWISSTIFVRGYPERQREKSIAASTESRRTVHSGVCGRGGRNTCPSTDPPRTEGGRAPGPPTSIGTRGTDQ